MARFSAGGEADEGPSSPRRNRQKNRDSPQQASWHDPEDEEIELVEDDDEVLEEENDQNEEEGDEEDEDDEEEEEEEGRGGDDHPSLIMPRSSNRPAGVGPIRNAAICVTLTDPEVLDCPVCYHSLTIPVFQCENGHTACSSCCKKISHKCPSCSLPIGYNRCRAIEKVLESVKLPCQNLMYGCGEMVIFSKKFDHDKTCNQTPCSCPLLGCSFIGSSRQLYQHFSSKHKGSATHFQYNNTFPVFFTLNDKSHILQEEKGVVFILNNRAEILGNLITISCIAPSSSNGGCYYEIAAKMEGSNLRFQSFTKNIQKVNDDDPHADDFLVIPNSFFGSYGQISLDVGIWRYGVYPACIQKRTSANSQRTTSTNMQSSTDANVQSSTET
ncbi:hypothetical protein P3X46_016194 [Hevea brasiliensis]|uniref:RING-type E3 ubiquitin transferase n=1 Tax=Hevea brasiliensis TaxID=3981 RepID=A0ABQ9M299_HEVBR|nr:putative E3 ubiquitin-protein ligase SINA-like 6 [Hevea brasiliensis]KAJ9173016.1 hypothetical protein P3X46_016194 [Hevea brasiliensis]